jgi:hypothetical protein
MQLVSDIDLFQGPKTTFLWENNETNILPLLVAGEIERILAGLGDVGGTTSEAGALGTPAR